LNEPKNLGKGGWENCENDYLVYQMYQECRELCRELERKMSCFIGTEDRKEKILKECADVANFVMMIADNVKALDD
jgi:hypothetical protein